MPYDMVVTCTLTMYFLGWTGGAMGSADEVNIQASELNRTMKVPAPPCPS